VFTAEGANPLPATLTRPKPGGALTGFKEILAPPRLLVTMKTAEIDGPGTTLASVNVIVCGTELTPLDATVILPVRTPLEPMTQVGVPVKKGSLGLKLSAA
jgi:hypothetical protein